MHITTRQRDTVREIAARIGLEEPLRWVYERLEPAARRDRLDNEHMRLLLAFSLAEDSNCIDIGAHSGMILREMVRCAPRGRHLAFEPLPDLAARLTQEFPHVEVHNAAVADYAGRTTFQSIPEDPMQSGLKQRDGVPAERFVPITVDVERLDDAVPADYSPTLVKIDVEGGERQVIEGAMQLLARHRPIICFEHGPGAEREYETGPEQIYDLIAGQLGMRIFDIDGDGPYTRERFIATYWAPMWNFVAHP